MSYTLYPYKITQTIIHLTPEVLIFWDPGHYQNLTGTLTPGPI